MFGPRHSELHVNGVSFVAEDSSEPDLNHGQIGRNRYEHIEQTFSQPADLRIFVLHHHLLPVPGTGRERNIVYDAGDLLEVLLRSRVNLVLAGHKHVPYAWRLEDLFVVTTGTVSTLRLRGHTRPCYNVIEIDPRLRADRAPVSVRRAGADHRVVARDAPRVREGGPAELLAVEGPAERGAAMRVIALVDGEHHPAVVRAALDSLAEQHEIAARAVRRRRGEGRRAPCSPTRARTTAAT